LRIAQDGPFINSYSSIEPIQFETARLRELADVSSDLELAVHGVSSICRQTASPRQESGERSHDAGCPYRA
jgi:hypothetical protein